MAKSDKEKKRLKFIKKAMEIHRGEGLDYSQVEYINNRTPVKIIDPEYGEFWQTPSNHLKGQHHPKRRGYYISIVKRSKQEGIIKRFEKVHSGEGLDYSQVEYVNMHTKVKIIDPEYGEFWQTPSAHLKGCGHPKRAQERAAQLCRSNTESFVEKAMQIHFNCDYDYSKVNYVNNRTKVEIICKKHGSFMATPHNVLAGKGCPLCGFTISKSENDICEFIRSLIGKDNVIQSDCTLLNGKEIDIYIPSYKLAIEYNGLRWHSEMYNKDKNYHLDKTNECASKGVNLIHIFEDEYIDNRTLVLSKLKHILGKDTDLPKVCGRKCTISVIDNNTAEKFLNEYHIQGFVVSSVYLGAYFNGELIAVMTFKRQYKNGNEWELNRFASNYNYRCQGVGGKLFSYFIRNYNPKRIKSFLDKRWCHNRKHNIYTQLGFTDMGDTSPDYSYYDSHTIKRYHKFGFRKHILHKKYGLPLTMAEGEMIEQLGFYKIWNCGLIKYEWKSAKE